MNVDFEALKARLEEAGRRLEGARSAEAAEALLKQRSRRLAERGRAGEARRLLGQVVVVRRGALLLGLPVESVREIREVEVARLPGSRLEGLFQIRGRCFCLVDVLGAFGKATPLGHGERTHAALVEGGAGVAGIRLDEVHATREVFADEVVDSPETRDVGFVSAVTRDRIRILDVDRLLSAEASAG